MVDSNNLRVASGNTRKAEVNRMNDPRSGMSIADSNEIFSSNVDKKTVKSCNDSCDNLT